MLVFPIASSLSRTEPLYLRDLINASCYLLQRNRVFGSHTLN